MDQLTFETIAQLARDMGAGGVALIPSSSIVIDDNLAGLCADPGCENYNQSLSCPPHVAGPDGMREYIQTRPQAIVFKIEVASEILIAPSEERRQMFRLLHEIAAAIESAAIRAGFSESMGFAGGACRRVFCHEYPDCAALENSEECRNPDLARPSMSGFGINVNELKKSSGWPLNRTDGADDPSEMKMGTLCGMVLVG